MYVDHAKRLSTTLVNSYNTPRKLHLRYLKMFWIHALTTNTHLQVFMDSVIGNQRDTLQLSIYEFSKKSSSEQLQLSSVYRASNKSRAVFCGLMENCIETIIICFKNMLKVALVKVFQIRITHLVLTRNFPKN